MESESTEPLVADEASGEHKKRRRGKRGGKRNRKEAEAGAGDVATEAVEPTPAEPVQAIPTRLAGTIAEKARKTEETPPDRKVQEDRG